MQVQRHPRAQRNDSSMNRKSKITPEQRQEILLAYLEKGHHAAAALSARYGVSAKYASTIAASLGVSRRQHVKSQRDPRWQWAIDRGVISI